MKNQPGTMTDTLQLGAPYKEWEEHHEGPRARVIFQQGPGSQLSGDVQFGVPYVANVTNYGVGLRDAPHLESRVLLPNIPTGPVHLNQRVGELVTTYRPLGPLYYTPY